MSTTIPRFLTFFLLVGLLLTATHAQQKETPKQRKRAISVAVIAPSLSTSREAKRVIAQQGWTQGKMKTADAILGTGSGNDFRV